MISFTMSISQSTMTTAYPILMKQFGIDAAAVQWVTSGFMVAMTLVMPLSPWLLDNLHLKKLLNLIVAVFLVGTAIAMVTPNFLGVIVGRLLEGVAVGALFPTYQAVIMENTNKEDRGIAMGAVGLVMSSALAVGPIVSGIVLQFGTWRLLFAFFFVVLLGLILFMQKQIQNTHQLNKRDFDFLSAFLLIGFAGILYTVSILPAKGWSWTLIVTLIVSLLLLVIFVIRQLKMDNPFLDLRVFEHRGYLPAMLLTGMSYSGLITATVIMPLYFQKVFLLAPIWSGLLMIPGAVFLSFLNPKAGRLLGQIGLRPLVYIGSSMMLLGYLFLAVFGTKFLLLAILGAMMLEGGNAFIMMPAVTAASNALPKHLISHGTAIITTMRQLIGALSILLAGLLIGFFHQEHSYGSALNLTAAWFVLVPLTGYFLASRIKSKK
ncbi:MFS transporter [Fructobacillus sp. M1-13]|uniref:Multidrug efflux MFS transporter n=1 Tax=Fructobacillus papyriferae TaxID=2713171 RepID=A0ABS5QP75_9LACO|nr:MFS transporter [Fructobacillus papyriferae]MBS9334968.1 multidrug efflux MFS transporter [Fructobacillus papyriferae]MCD2159548.1 MFS transporter [Fructobacillus papyriferae]